MFGSQNLPWKSYLSRKLVVAKPPAVVDLVSCPSEGQPECVETTRCTQ